MFVEKCDWLLDFCESVCTLRIYILNIRTFIYIYMIYVYT